MQLMQIFIFCTSVVDFTVCFKSKECVPYPSYSKNSLNVLPVFGDKKTDAFKAVQFLLFTRKNRNCTQELLLNDKESVLYSNFSPLIPTRVLIHGWKNDQYSEMVHLIKEAYLDRGLYNVIVVNWGLVSKNINYMAVTSSVSSVGFVVSKFFEFLNKISGVSYNNIYLIGHSLGAHVAGVTGYYLKQKIGVIFALDPAEPGFTNVSLEYKIDSSDAKYVEVMHTDVDILGTPDPAGHADFYPNYGQGQIGCIRFFSGCSHIRAYKYFAEAINSKTGFWAKQCTDMNEIRKRNCSCIGNFVRMAEEPIVPKKGLYYLTTKKYSPYAMGKS